MSVDDLLVRHRTLPRDAALADLPLGAAQQTVVVCCMDHRVDPADFLGLAPGEAVVIRNVGGRVTDAVVRDLAYLQLLCRTFLEPDRATMDVLVVHHTECGSRALLLDEVANTFRAVVDDPELDPIAVAVADPVATVTADVRRLRIDRRVSGFGTIRGATYDVATGRLTDVEA